MLDNLSVTKEFVKRNQSLLHSGAIAGLILGFGAWSITPFLESDRYNVIIRVLGSTAGILGGAAAISCGNDLEKIRPLAKAVKRAEEDIFLHGIAASQYSQQQQLDGEAEALSQLPFSLPAHFPTSQAEALEVPDSATSQTSTSTLLTSQLPCDVETYQKVREAVSEEKSMTFIVEDILGMKGKKFEEGKQLYQSILNAIVSQGEG